MQLNVAQAVGSRDHNLKEFEQLEAKSYRYGILLSALELEDWLSSQPFSKNPKRLNP